jgi:methyl-accepting chemotaxis protein
MQRLLQSLKDPSKFSLLLSVLFYIGLAASAYVLFTLPHDLVFKGGMVSSGLETALYTRLFIVIIATFALGVFAINAAFRAKKEIIVFKEKKSESDSAATTAASSQQTSFDLLAFTKAIKGTKPDQVFQIGINTICKVLEAGQGAFYLVKDDNGKRFVQMKSAFAIPLDSSEPVVYEFGEGLVGQCATTGKSILLDELPEGYTNTIVSGLGMAIPKCILLVPVKKGDTVIAILEIATFSMPTDKIRQDAEQMAKILAEQI